MKKRPPVKKETQSRTERLIDRIKKNPLVLILGLLVGFVTIVSGVITNLGTIETAVNNFFHLPSKTQMPIYTYRGHGNYVYSISWSPDSKRIASSSADQTVQLWDATTGEHPLFHHFSFTDLGYGSVIDVSWSSNGKYIASTTGLQVQVWDAVTGNINRIYQVHSISDPPEAVNAAWSPTNGKLIASTSYGTVHVWNITDGRDKIIYPTPGNPGFAPAIAWSPDGNYIASTEDNKVYVWEVADKRTILTYTGHYKRVVILASGIMI